MNKIKNKFIFVIAPGRSGSTFVTQLLSTQLNKNYISQEMYGHELFENLSKFIENEDPNYLQNYNQKLQKYIEEKKGLDIRHPHYVYFYENMDFNKLKLELENITKKHEIIYEYLDKCVFNCDSDIKGCKILASEKHINTVCKMIKYLSENCDFIYFIINTRNISDLMKSREKTFWDSQDQKEVEETYNMLNQLKHPRIFHVQYENVVNQLPEIINEIGMEFDEEKYKKAVYTRCSY